MMRLVVIIFLLALGTLRAPTAYAYCSNPRQADCQPTARYKCFSNNVLVRCCSQANDAECTSRGGTTSENPDNPANQRFAPPQSRLCEYAGVAKNDCITCMDQEKGAWTAIGCIKADASGSFVTTFLRFGIGIGGGIAFLLILFGGFQIITAAGNPERMNEGKEVVSSAISGLLMIIFSILILKIVGVDILGIPDFKSS